MALSLTAEQKGILKIFKIEEQYIIPAYQRPYSWEYDHCFQLYNDLMEAFESSDGQDLKKVLNFKRDDFEKRLKECQDKKGNFFRGDN